MTIAGARARAIHLVPNTIEPRIFVEWLNRLEWQIKTEIFDNYTDEIEFNGYGADTADDTDLLVKQPYDELYIRYLEAQIYRSYNELNKYNNCITEFNAIYKQFKAQYNRTHTHKGANRYSFYGG